ncbi:flagellar FliL protein [Crenobacter luteus]|uniref:Flagellar protein FliL n=1 Tax=Crenobacter luteus TaxID=1452487 RepID=A0A163D5D3_9NEIS|nr:flagellar basal body-associated FliL family protein [Crenobacter luteus]KZE33896.1 flagellar basal body-associated protein FliL [Crenobacter luteus]TCP15749.1 flagellar FliL protein [Crenobacter luteus]
MAEEQKKDKKAGGGANKLLVIVIVLLVLVLAAVGALTAYVFSSMQKGGAAHAETVEAPVKKKKKDGPPIFQKLDTFVVNLAGNTGAMLQIEMQAELVDEDAKKRFTDYMPKVRSALILLLSSKSAEELATPDGKVKLKAQVKKIINESMDAGDEEPVDSVLFTSFIIQEQ